MKTSFRYLLPLLFTFCLTSGALYSQQLHTVTLHVDLNQLNQGNPSKACTFSADANTDVIGDNTPENFTIVVNELDEIEWVAIASNGEEIDIENVEVFTPTGKEKPFKKNKLRGKRANSNKKKVKSEIKRNTKGNTYKYNVEFSVNGVPFIVDPKIKVGV